MTKELGKISKVYFGYGGYQDAMFGLTLIFESHGGSCGHFIGYWPLQEDHDPKKSHEQAFCAMEEIASTMKDAKVTEANQLVGKPVELTFNGLKLEAWRILTEVL